MSTPRPNPKLEDHPLSDVRDCLFSIFAATLHIGDRSSIRNLRTRHAVVTGNHQNIVRVIKSRRMRWAGHVARMGERIGAYRVLVRKPEGKRRLGRPRRNGRIILRWIFREWNVGVWTGSSWLRIRTSGGHL